MTTLSKRERIQGFAKGYWDLCEKYDVEICSPLILAEDATYSLERISLIETDDEWDELINNPEY